MIGLALATETRTLWEVSLAVGGVVVIVVIALLGTLLYLVGAIDSGTKQLLGVAARVAGNTGKIGAVGTVVATLEDVAAEAGRHAELLGVR